MKSASVSEVSVESFISRVVADGGHFLVGEYRGSAVSVVEYLDKESGKKESYVKVTHSVEVRGPSGLETVHVQEMIDRSITSPEQYKNQCWLVPGMRVVVTPRRGEVDKGIKKFTCTSGDMQLLRGGAQGEVIGKK
jgi:hypothetical protein